MAPGRVCHHVGSAERNSVDPGVRPSRACAVADSMPAAEKVGVSTAAKPTMSSAPVRLIMSTEMGTSEAPASRWAPNFSLMMAPA